MDLLLEPFSDILSFQELPWKAVPGNVCPGKCSGVGSGGGGGGVAGTKASAGNMSGKHSILCLPFGTHIRALKDLRSPAVK